jgi:hypothetical protein
VKSFDKKRDGQQPDEQAKIFSHGSTTAVISEFLLTQELARARGEKSYKLNEETTPNGYSSSQKSVY